MDEYCKMVAAFHELVDCCLILGWIVVVYCVRILVST